MWIRVLRMNDKSDRAMVVVARSCGGRNDERLKPYPSKLTSSLGRLPTDSPAVTSHVLRRDPARGTSVLQFQCCFLSNSVFPSGAGHATTVLILPGRNRRL
jgi:hypothetical protein